MNPSHHCLHDSYDSNSHEEEKGFLPSTEKPIPNNQYMLWIRVFWPLVVHGFLALAVGVLMVFYVNENIFNLTERKPSVTLADGITTSWTHYAPLQSDVTTLVSSILAVLRLVTAAWLGPLIWRCAFILMEMPGGGLKPSQLQMMISYGIPVLTRKGGRTIWVILAIVLPVHVIAPVLTGSITWIPHSQLVEQPTGSTIQIPAATESSSAWTRWNVDSELRERICIQAIGLASTAWSNDLGDDSLHGVIKRVIPSAGHLKVDSVLSNVTLPSFSVTNLDWVQDPEIVLALGQDRGFQLVDALCKRISLTDVPLSCNLLDIPGVFTLIPDMNTPPIWEFSRAFPSPLVVSEARDMILYVHAPGQVGEFTNAPCRSLPGLKPFPNSTTTRQCWAFARVTYTAGASVCTNCGISARATVQNDTALSVTSDPLTADVLSMMPTVIGMMVLQNTTEFTPETNANEYVVRLLSRSYAASWAALAHYLGQTLPSLNTTYSAAIPSSQAIVDLPRVWVWLGMQLLVTVSGAIFAWVQINTASVAIGDTALAAFYLDSGDVSAHNSRLRDGPLRKLEYDGRQLKVKLS